MHELEDITKGPFVKFGKYRGKVLTYKSVSYCVTTDHSKIVLDRLKNNMGEYHYILTAPTSMTTENKKKLIKQAQSMSIDELEKMEKTVGKESSKLEKESEKQMKAAIKEFTKSIEKRKDEMYNKYGKKLNLQSPSDLEQGDMNKEAYKDFIEEVFFVVEKKTAESILDSANSAMTQHEILKIAVNHAKNTAKELKSAQKRLFAPFIVDDGFLHIWAFYAQDQMFLTFLPDNVHFAAGDKTMFYVRVPVKEASNLMITFTTHVDKISQYLTDTMITQVPIPNKYMHKVISVQKTNAASEQKSPKAMFTGTSVTITTNGDKFVMKLDKSLPSPRNWFTRIFTRR
jgi:hypothetical protein